MNIIKEVIVGTIEFAKDFVLHVAKAIHRTTGFEDNVIIVGTSVTIMVAPIVYFLLETFTQNFDWKKLTAIIVIASTFFGSVLGKDNLTFTETLTKHATVSGTIAFCMSIAISVVLIFQDPYYSGLFGRFRDDD